MDWHEGNIWRSERIKVSDLTNDTFEYKFLIGNSDGFVVQWQSGINN